MKPSLVIVGLGNLGKEYERSRHNVGFLALDAIAKEFAEGEWKDMQKFDSIGMESRILTIPVLLLKPTTYMNLSGNAVRKVMDFYKLDPSSQLLVLTDDIDIPLGEHRLRKKGGPGTHNGLKSICDIYDDNYARVRIGLGTPSHAEDLATWVLSTPSPTEIAALQGVIQAIPELVRNYVLETTTEESASS